MLSFFLRGFDIIDINGENMTKRLKIPDSYTISQILVRVVVIVLTVLFVIWAVQFVPPIIHWVF
mgnify:CR=1 FL=1